MIDLKGLKACVQRTMCGGGNSYDVIWKCNQKAFEPLAFGAYATKIHPSFEKSFKDDSYYYRTRDMLRIHPDQESKLEGDERIEYFKAIEVKAKEIDKQLMKRVFNLQNVDKILFIMPTNEKSKRRTVTF